MTLPELSVEGFHASDTVYGVMPVTRRFVGVVGGFRSPAADAGETGKINTSTSRLAASAGSLEKSRIFILFTPFLKLDDLSIRL
jgi:hypothetical protein